MGVIFMLLAVVCYIGAFVCGIIILIDAFKNAVWKGIVSILCGLYMLYFAFVEFQHEKKALIIAGWLLGGLLGSILYTLGGGQALAAAQ